MLLLKPFIRLKSIVRLKKPLLRHVLSNFGKISRSYVERGVFAFESGVSEEVK